MMTFHKQKTRLWLRDALRLGHFIVKSTIIWTFQFSRLFRDTKRYGI